MQHRFLASFAMILSFAPFVLPVLILINLSILLFGRLASWGLIRLSLNPSKQFVSEIIVDVLTNAV